MNNPTTITLRAEAATNLSAAANIGRGIAQNAAGFAVLAGVDGSDIVGILVDGGRAAGEPVLVAVAGTVKARAGGVINEGDPCTSEADGDIIAAALDDQFIGKCIQRGGAAAGEMFDLLLGVSWGPTAAAI